MLLFEMMHTRKYWLNSVLGAVDLSKTYNISKIMMSEQLFHHSVSMEQHKGQLSKTQMQNSAIKLHVNNIRNVFKSSSIWGWHSKLTDLCNRLGLSHAVGLCTLISHLYRLWADGHKDSLLPQYFFFFILFQRIWRPGVSFIFSAFNCLSQEDF